MSTKTKTTTTTKPASHKRKMGQKYYAVRTGIRPGVYLTWGECQAQTAGFKGAQYKSFLSREHAEAFVAGQNPGGSNQQGVPRFYAVAVGNTPGVYTDWADAQKAIVGARGPKYKKFATRVEADEYMRQHARGTVVVLDEAQGTVESDDEQPARKRVKRTSDGSGSASGSAPASASASASGSAPASGSGSASASASGTTSSVEDTPGLVKIYTDGSCLHNGKSSAAAGVGVYFGDGDERNIAERLPGPVQTNQRAELMAILQALEAVPTDTSVLIFTDSKYSLNCVTTWFRKWATDGWKTSGGVAVMNQDLIKPIRARIEARDAAGAETNFCWVKGHSADKGNAAADELAVRGARLPVRA